MFEDCSRDVNLYTEFCTAAPITSGYGQVWKYSDGDFDNTETGTWTKIRNEVRTFHKTTRMGQDPPDGHSQHTSNIGDVCYGDAGGSVWKYWMFRDPGAAEDKRVHKLAVLTGVVSRSVWQHCIRLLYDDNLLAFVQMLRGSEWRQMVKIQASSTSEC